MLSLFISQIVPAENLESFSPIYASNTFTLRFRSTYVVRLDTSTGQIKDITNG
jgi:hypothetical protein